jgi:microcystin-dependent protein
MTINTTTSRADYAGNGVTTVFPVPFDFFDASELRVVERVVSTGAETVLALGAGYTVTGGNGDAGAVTASVAPATGRNLVILRQTARTQLVDYVSADPFPAETHELALDRLTAITQEIERDVARSVRVAETDTVAVVLPPAPARANKVLSFDDFGNAAMLAAGVDGITGPQGPIGPPGPGAPIGSVIAWPGATAPAGWLLCHGQAVPRLTYPALFTAIGVTYGAGDGSNTFNLPDLRGRVVVARDNMGGSAANRVTAAVSGLDAVVLGAVGGDQRLQQHLHGVNDPGHAHGADDSEAGAHTHTLPGSVLDSAVADGVGLGGAPGFSGSTTGSAGAHNHDITVFPAGTNISIQNAGAGGSQNVQPSIVLNYIICAQNEAGEGGVVAAHVHSIEDVSGLQEALDAAGSGGAGKYVRTFRPIDNEPPASAFATLDTRNSRPCLDFDTTTQEAAVFSDVLPSTYGGGGLVVTVHCALTSATSGTVGWDVAIERIDASGLDLDSDSFATAQTITAATVPGTSGQVLAMSVTLTNGAQMDSLAAGEPYRLRLRRDVANDTAAGDAELFFVTVREA